MTNTAHLTITWQNTPIPIAYMPDPTLKEDDGPPRWWVDLPKDGGPSMIDTLMNLSVEDRRLDLLARYLEDDSELAKTVEDLLNWLHFGSEQERPPVEYEVE